MECTQRFNIPDLFLGANAEFITDEFKSIKKLLLSQNNPDSPLIHDIDIAPNGSTNIMYYIEQDHELEAFIRGIPSLLQQHVLSTDIPKVYKKAVSVNKLLNQRRVTNNERKFWDEMEKTLGTNPQDPENASSSSGLSSASSKQSYAATASACHTQTPPSSVLPQDKRLSNMEHSVRAIQKEYMTKAEVEAIVKSNSETNKATPSATPDSINSMIDAKLETFKHPEPPPSLSEADVQALIDKAAESSESLLTNSKKVQTMINDSISKFRAELKITHEKLAKSILKVTTTTTNLSASITALQEQNKELSDLFFDKLSDPAISPINVTGAKVEEWLLGNTP